jgi:superfamily II DNA/RNA helicase
LGWHSTLCAARVPEANIDDFVSEVNRHPGVTHNYLRNHAWNIWFTFIAPSKEKVAAILAEITEKTGISILNLPSQNMFKVIKKTLEDTSPLPKKSIVYSNIRRRVIDLQLQIGNYLDADDHINHHEVIVIHGQLSKVEQGTYTRFFLDPEHPEDANINVLCTTSGDGNVGLDSPHIRNVLRMDLPPSPLDFVQEIGRAGRVNPSDPDNFSYILFAKIVTAGDCDGIQISFLLRLTLN